MAGEGMTSSSVFARLVSRLRSNSSTNYVLLQLGEDTGLNLTLARGRGADRAVDRVTAEEVVIVVLVLGLWVWACLVFYVRWQKISRIETCNDYRPHLRLSLSPPPPPPITLPEDGADSQDNLTRLMFYILKHS